MRLPAWPFRERLGHFTATVSSLGVSPCDFSASLACSPYASFQNELSLHKKVAILARELLPNANLPPNSTMNGLGMSHHGSGSTFYHWEHFDVWLHYMFGYILRPHTSIFLLLYYPDPD